MAHHNALETCCNLLEFIEKMGGKSALRDNTKYHMVHEVLKVTSWSALAGVMPETAKALKHELEVLCDHFKRCLETSSISLEGQPGRLPSARWTPHELPARGADGGADVPRQERGETDAKHATQASPAHVPGPDGVRSQPEMPRGVEQATGGMQRARVQAPGTKHGPAGMGRKGQK